MEDYWPKTATAYIYSDKEAMWDIGKKLKLKGEALSLFRHALCELTVTISVSPNGTYNIVEVKE